MTDVETAFPISCVWSWEVQRKGPGGQGDTGVSQGDLSGAI